MSKYDALGTYLRGQIVDQVPMTFGEIERITGAKLPASASRYRAWWSNNGSNSVLTKIWLDAGFRSTQVDMTKRKLVFERARGRQGFAEEKMGFDLPDQETMKHSKHPMIGALKGTFTIEEGWDLTKPALDPEELAEWEANLDRTADMIAEGLRGKRR